MKTKTIHSGKPSIIEPDPLFQALIPPMPDRQASKAMHRASNSAPSRSRIWVVRSEALAVKKSTMMLPRRTWHHGMNRAMAAPAAEPESSKSVSSTPASTAQALARVSRIFKRQSPVKGVAV